MTGEMLVPFRAGPTNRTGMVEFEGDLISPNTSYLRAVDQTAIGSRGFATAASTAWTRSPVVNRRNRQQGLIYNYLFGAVRQATRLPYPGEADGMVRSSSFQQDFIQGVRGWTTNLGWFQGGYPRNLGWTFRTQQIRTNPTGGPTPSRMGQAPVFTRVQTVPRYSTVPPAFQTVSARS